MAGWEEENGWHLVTTATMHAEDGRYYPPGPNGTLGPWVPGFSRWAAKHIVGPGGFCVGLNLYIGTTYQGTPGTVCVSTNDPWLELSNPFPAADDYYFDADPSVHEGTIELWVGNSPLPQEPASGVNPTEPTLEGIAGSADHIHAHLHLILASIRKDY